MKYFFQSIMPLIVPKADERLESFYFCEDDEGRNVFYPWGHPGESYFVSEEQKKKLRVFIYGMFILMVVPTPLILLYHDLLSKGPSGSVWMVALPITAYLPVHWISAFFLVKDLPPYELHPSNFLGGNNNVQLSKKLFELGLVQFAIILFGILQNPQDYLLKIVSAGVVTFFTILVFVARYRKGYIFQNPPNSIE